MALILQFGEPIKQITNPGLKIKLPMVQNILRFDKRLQHLHADTSEVIALDQKTMRVDAFAKYKIIDVLKFYQTAQNEYKFKSRLSTILDSSLRQVLGSFPFDVLLSDQRAEIMHKISNIVNTEAAGFGVEVVDVRIMRADLPDNSREAVYKRMRAGREKEAREIRAQGNEEADRITSAANKDKALILASAKKFAEILKGEGEAKAIEIFTASFEQDPVFFDFYKSLDVYKSVFTKDSTTLVITPNSKFMRHMEVGTRSKK
jgi:membrane protease subunit HflC